MLEKIPQKVHFVGIGGIGMSALAQHLLRCGHVVSGSDRQANDQTDKLRALGANITIGHAASAVQGAQLVVHTSAIPADNCELAYARTNGITTMLREELLGRVFNAFETRIAVCGAHGKTTVTAMIHHVLERCGVAHTAFIGGEYDGSNYFFGQNVVVAEACEYNRSFLHLRPSICVCVNVEHDHPDCYPTPADTENAFCQMFAQSQRVIIPQKYQYLCPNALFCGQDIAADNQNITNGYATFDVICQGARVGATTLSIVGQHNVDNAISAISVAYLLGLPMLQVLHALRTFRGVDRRWTAHQGVCRVVCDYAHHPTEIQAALATARQTANNGRIICVFQPHTYSRTQAFFDRFVDCFTGADEIIYLPVYSAREQPIAGVTSYGLYRKARQQGLNAKYRASFQQVAAYLRRIARPSDLVLLVGAGDVNTLADLLK